MNILVSSVVPERVQRTIVHERVHILGERELNVLYFYFMNNIVNAFVSGVCERHFLAFNFVQE